MCPQMGVVTDADLAAAIAVHNALTIVHGTVNDVADQADIAAHAAILDAHHFEPFETVQLNRYLLSPLVPYVGAAAITANRLYAGAYPIQRARTADRIALQVTVGGGVGGVRLGIYADDGNCYPGALVVDAGVIDANVVAFATLNITEALARGLYWLALLSDVTPTVTHAGGLLSIVGSVLPEPRSGFYVAQGYGVLPDPFPAGGSVGYRGTGLCLRFSSMD